MTRTLRIGTRGSTLALVQARWVADRLAREGVATELVTIRTQGDERPPDTAWGEGAFVRGIEAALLEGSIDVAVHSAKDVPTDEHPALRVAAYPVREDARDALVCRVRGTTLATLPAGSRVGTDSPRRSAFVLAARPDLVVHPLHGNVDTRLRRLDAGDTDALVLAVAGLARLGRSDRIDEVLSPDLVTPAPGQGALAVQVRADDAAAGDAVRRIDDAGTRIAVETERAILRRSGGGCRSPIGVTARWSADAFEVVAGAERDWTPGVEATIPAPRVGWVRAAAGSSGSTTATGEAWASDDLVQHVAARIVSLRGAPRALVGRPVNQAGPLLAALAEAGIDAAHVPAIEIGPAGAGEHLEAAIRDQHAGGWIVVTSANAVDPLAAALRAAGRPVADFRWAAVGSATAEPLRGLGVSEVFLPARADAATLAATLPVAQGDEVLLARGDLAEPGPVETLRGRGATVRDVVAYRTTEAPPSSRERLAAILDDGPIDVLVVTSGSVARGFAGLVDGPARAQLLATPVVAAGVTTAQAARHAGFSTVLTAPAPDAASLAGFTARALGVVRRDAAPRAEGRAAASRGPEAS